MSNIFKITAEASVHLLRGGAGKGKSPCSMIACAEMHSSARMDALSDRQEKAEMPSSPALQSQHQCAGGGGAAKH